jgi:hypothetical protein
MERVEGSTASSSPGGPPELGPGDEDGSTGSKIKLRRFERMPKSLLKFTFLVYSYNLTINIGLNILINEILIKRARQGTTGHAQMFWNVPHAPRRNTATYTNTKSKQVVMRSELERVIHKLIPSGVGTSACPFGPVETYAPLQPN